MGRLRTTDGGSRRGRGGSPSARAPPPPAPAYVRRNRQEGGFPENLFSRSPGILPPLSVHASSFYEAASFPGSPLPLPFLSHTQRFYLFVYNTLPIPRMPFISKHLTVSVTGGRAAAQGARQSCHPFVSDRMVLGSGTGPRGHSASPAPLPFSSPLWKRAPCTWLAPGELDWSAALRGFTCVCCVRRDRRSCRRVAEKPTLCGEAHPLGPAPEA